jgi:predicted metalloprotease with PDZ domain
MAPVKRLALSLLALSSIGQAAEYTIGADSDTQLAIVSIKVKTGAAAFNMPAWAPGDYEILNYGQSVKSISFFRAGKEVPSKSAGPNRWTIDGGADSVVYSVAPSRGNFTPNLRIRANEYYVSGPGVLGWFDGHADEEQRIALISPKGWKSSMALPKSIASAPLGIDGMHHTYTAPNYDVLIDSPFVVGTTIREQKFEVRGKPHRIVAYNMADEADLKAFADVGAKIVEEAFKLFGEFGYDQYDFMLDFGGPGGGLEHLNCTRIGLSTRATAQSAIGIMAHEYFHNYNVKRIRAKSLGPFDYSKPAMTGTIWWLEGVTDYFADVLLTRSGLRSMGEFQRGEAGSIRAASQGAYLKVSADEASRKVWTTKGSYGFGGVNYYARGHAAGAVLDLAIRAHSGGKHALDDVIKALWEECKGNKPGYEDIRIRELCVKFGGAPLGQIYDDCVMKAGPLPVEAAMAPWSGKLGENGFEVSETAKSSFGTWPLKIN